MKIEISNLKLASFTKTFCSNNFIYSEVEGKADCLSWFIIFFKENGTDNVSAISFEDIFAQESLTKVANKVLEAIMFPIKFGDNLNLIKEKFGNLTFSDFILENISRYYYWDKQQKLLLCFNVNSNQILCGLEIITNENIIKNRIEVLEL